MESAILESRVNDLTKIVEELKRTPNQAVIDKTMSLLLSKLDDRDHIIDLELKNLSKAIQLDIQDILAKSHKELEDKLELKLKQVIEGQKDRISWGMEMVRFIIVIIMFILSIKLVK